MSCICMEEGKIANLGDYFQASLHMARYVKIYIQLNTEGGGGVSIKQKGIPHLDK